MNDKNLAYSVAIVFVAMLLSLFAALYIIDMQKNTNIAMKSRIEKLEKELEVEKVERVQEVALLENEVSFFLNGGWK